MLAEPIESLIWYDNARLFWVDGGIRKVLVVDVRFVSMYAH